MEKILTMCGYRCDLCKAYAPNSKKKDERNLLSQVWKKYYDLDIKKEDIYCDGCRCDHYHVKRIDQNCPVRACVISRNIESCGKCNDFPCDTFHKRKGLSAKEAKEKLNQDFNQEEYDNYLLAYDNLTRLKAYRKNKK